MNLIPWADPGTQQHGGRLPVCNLLSSVPGARRRPCSQPAHRQAAGAGHAAPFPSLGLILLLALAPIATAHATSHPAEQYVEGEAIVTFKQSADFATAQRTLQNHSLKFGRHFAALSQHRGRHSGLVHGSGTTAQLITELAADPAVECAEPNYLRWVSSSSPNDPLFSQL